MRYRSIVGKEPTMFNMVNLLRAMDLTYKVSELLTRSWPVDDTLTKVLDYVFDTVERIDLAVVILIDPETGAIEKSLAKRRESSGNNKPLYSWDVVARVLQKGEPTIINDTYSEYEDGFSEAFKFSRIRSVMGVPLVSGSNTMGVFYVESLNEPIGFQNEDVTLFTYLSRRIASGIKESVKGVKCINYCS
jgi:GAF domain-containing protein